MNKHTCLLLGIRLLQSDDDSLDKYYSYEESNPDNNIDYYWCEGSKYAYIGRCLVESDDCSSDHHKKIETGDFIYLSDSIYEELRNIGLNCEETDIKLYFFDYWG